MQNINADQFKGGGWRKDTEGEEKLKIQKKVGNSGAGFSLDLTLAGEPKFRAVPD